MPRRLRSGVLSLVVLFAVIQAVATMWDLAAAAGTAVFLSSLLAAALPVPVYAGLILWLDRHEREPAVLLLTVFLWGALVASGLSVAVNTTVRDALAPVLGDAAAGKVWTVASAPVVEEVSKGAALLALFVLARQEFDNTLDGLVYGVLVGLGFTFFENAAYITRYSPTLFGGGIAGLTGMFFVRQLAGFGHSLWTGLTGVGFGLASQLPGRGIAVLAPLAGLASAMFLHATWNGAPRILSSLGITLSDAASIFLLMPAQFVILGLPVAATLMGVAYLAWRQESRVIGGELQDEVATGAVTPEELAVLGSARARRRHLLRTLRRHGVGAWWNLRRLCALQTDLAFRWWHARRGERMPPSQRAVMEETYRQRIAALRQRLRVTEVRTT